MLKTKKNVTVFNDPNYVKTLIIFFLISISLGIISFVLTSILPPALMETITPTEYSLIMNLGIGVVFSIGLRLIFKQSIYFRISLCFSLCSTAIGLSSSITRMAGETLAVTLITYSVIGSFCVFLVIYTIKTVQTPLSSLQNQLEQIYQGNLAFEEEGLEAYGTEFGLVEKALAKTVDNISQIIFESQKVAENLSTSSEELATSATEVNALSEEIASTIQQFSRGASNQSVLSEQGINDVHKMSNGVDQTLQNIV